jgi:peptidoglycan/LPS O-acetylase OafA/YrhL
MTPTELDPASGERSMSPTRDGRVLAALGCVAGAICLVWHFGAEASPARPLPEALSWLGLGFALVLLFRALTPKARVAEATACLVAAVALYVIFFGSRAPIYGGAPWLVLLLGLVLLWTALGLREKTGSLIGVFMTLAGVAAFIVLILIDPILVIWWLEFDLPWLIVIGLAFPLCLGIVRNLEERRRKLPTAGSAARS